MMTEQTTEPLNLEQWTSCEVHGHMFVTDEDDSNLRVCADCGETYRESL
jgi:hypothetical protein